MYTDLTGYNFDKLQVICRDYDTGNKRGAYWKCLCECGKTCSKSTEYLNKVTNTFKSCNCLKYVPKNFIGTRFGKLVVTGIAEGHYPNRSNGIRWECLCDCGNVVSRTSVVLKDNRVRSERSCGCVKRPCASLVDYTGKSFGRWEVLKRARHESKDVYWLCKCRCGNQKEVAGHNLDRGISKSCGCLRRELTTWNQMERMGEDELRYLYLANHPIHKQYYKIGIAKDPNYRTQSLYGSLDILDKIQLFNWEVCLLETQILEATKDCQVRPEDMLKYTGISEWREGEKAVEIWHGTVSKYLRTAYPS